MTKRAIERLVRNWQVALRLSDWRIEVEVLPAQVVAEDKRWAEIDRRRHSLSATLRIAGRRSAEDIERSIIHELTHLVLTDEAALFECLTEATLDECGGTFARTEMMMLHEQATWRLEDCIYRLAQEARNVRTQVVDG